MTGKAFGWNNALRIDSFHFTCGHCGHPIASDVGYYKDNGEYIYICHFCECPTYMGRNRTKQVPGAICGEEVDDVNDPNILDLYNEARRCMTYSAYTASVLCCRKLLMNIAVSKGAKEGLKFIEYVEYLAAKNYIPPGGDEWVDHIRKKGNEATHEIVMMAKVDAEELIDFISMLLKFIYEFPAKMKRKKV